MEKRTLFIKPSRSLGGGERLDPVVVARNHARGIETSLSLDTNILISMEKVVKNGNKWSSVKAQGLHNLISLLQRCPPKSICISPGLALKEMPPEAANRSREYYESFLSAHLPEFVDTPNSTRTIYKAASDGYGFEDLSPESQAVMAVPFTCIAYLNLVDKKNHGKPIDKFKAYLDCLESKVDVLSAAEIEIAKYCFAEPPADCREVIDIRRRVRGNFLKTRDNKSPRSPSEVLAIAFNGASDLLLLQAANFMDEHGLDGVRQDSWIATKDEKLVDFSNIFHHVNLDGEAGKYAVSSVTFEHSKDGYWQQAEMDSGIRSLRRAHYHQSREIDMDVFVAAAHAVIEEVRLQFE